jgi:hypothetical protein
MAEPLIEAVLADTGGVVTVEPVKPVKVVSMPCAEKIGSD